MWRGALSRGRGPDVDLPLSLQHVSQDHAGGAVPGKMKDDPRSRYNETVY